MLNILKNFEKAASGKKPAGPAESGSMKAILEGFDRASKSDIAVEECGAMPMQMGSPQQEGTPVSMNVSINASGKENVDDLIALMKAVNGMSAEPEMVPNRKMDMDMAAMRAAVMGPQEEPEMDAEEDMEEWANSPEGSDSDERYSDHEYMTKDLSGGLNRSKPKGSERAKDPAVRQHVESVKEQLWAALNEKKSCSSKKKMTSEAEKQKGVDGKACWKGYRRMGTKKKGGKTVDNCVKVKS